MRKQQYTLIIYFISIVIAATLAIQVYWNYKNYQAGQSQLLRDVQVSLDKAVSDYYDTVATQNTLSFFQNASRFPTLNPGEIENITERIDSGEITLQSIVITEDNPNILIGGSKLDGIDTLLTNLPIKRDTSYFRTIEANTKDSKGRTTFKISGDSPSIVDSIFRRIEKNTTDSTLYNQGETFRFNFEADSSGSRLEALKDLTTKIVLSFNDDIIDIPKLDSIVALELKRKKISETSHKLFYSSGIKNSITTQDDFDLKVTSSSALLPDNSRLTLGFKDVAKIVFKRNLIGIILSILLLGAVISSLLYLLKIIKEQKQLAEIKNDFISNITHEFKTPIATIGVAMESIQHFNKENDPEKTNKYVDMSSQQVSKLNTMVEKLLETATLDSQALELNKDETNLPELLEAIAHKYDSTQEKKVTFTSDSDQTWLDIDAFHMENAIDNIVDNAVKYGGDVVNIAFAKAKNGIQIHISDNGNNLLKSQASQIFEKFYRVPKGNTHNVKGFGIGLYYTKTIIEKHEGHISVTTNPTTFKIVLPYV